MSEEQVRYERQPPYSEEAERGVLGAAMIDAPTVIPLVKRHYDIRKESFFVPAHQVLWDVLDEMFRSGVKVDMVTVGEHLKNKDLLEKAGGYALMELVIDDTPTSAHAEYYAGFVRNKALLRSITTITAEIMQQAYLPENAEEPEKFLAKIPQRFLEIAEGATHEVSREQVFSEVVQEMVEAKERRDAERRGEPVPPSKYLSLPWGHLNEQHGGGLRNYLYILGAESSAGKTAMAAQMADYAVRITGKKVVILSMDADPWEHAGRDMARTSGVSFWKASQGYARKDQIDAFGDAGRRLARNPIVIDSDSFTLGEQESRLRMEAMKGEIGLVIVDYIQLTRLGDHKVDQNENYRLGAVAKRYKQLARELGCPVMALSQINRSAASAGRFAAKQDLRGSGELDEVAHGIWLLLHDRDSKDHRGKVIRRAARAENYTFPVWVDVVKNKTGPKAAKEFWLYANYFRFEEAAEGDFDRCAEAQELGQPFHVEDDAPGEGTGPTGTEEQEEIIL